MITREGVIERGRGVGVLNMLGGDVLMIRHRRCLGRLNNKGHNNIMFMRAGVYCVTKSGRQLQNDR